MSAEDKAAMKAKIGADCMAKEGASDADMQVIQRHEVPKTPKEKCFAACVIETLGLVCRF